MAQLYAIKRNKQWQNVLGSYSALIVLGDMDNIDVGSFFNWLWSLGVLVTFDHFAQLKLGHAPIVQCMLVFPLPQVWETFYIQW